MAPPHPAVNSVIIRIGWSGISEDGGSKVFDQTFRDLGKNDAEKADAFIRWIENLKKEMQIPEYLDMIRDEDVEQIIKWAMKEANPLYPVPVIWDHDDLSRFIASVRR